MGSWGHSCGGGGGRGGEGGEGGEGREREEEKGGGGAPGGQRQQRGDQGAGHGQGRALQGGAGWGHGDTPVAGLGKAWESVEMRASAGTDQRTWASAASMDSARRVAMVCSCSCVAMKGGASSTWSPVRPSAVPPPG